MRTLYLFVRDLPLVLEAGETPATYVIHLGPILLGTLHDDGVFTATATLPEASSPADEVTVTGIGIDRDQRIRLAVEELIIILIARSKQRADELHLTAASRWSRSPNSDPSPGDWDRLRRGCP